VIDDDAVETDRMDALLFRIQGTIKRGIDDCDTSEEILRRVQSQITEVIRPPVVKPICHDPDADRIGEPPLWFLALIMIVAIVLVFI
jgi:hypothetical protein